MQVLQTFLALKIKELMTEDDKKDNKANRKQNIRQMSRREKKQYKQKVQLERELENVSLQDNKKKLRRIVSIYLYFLVLP